METVFEPGNQLVLDDLREDFATNKGDQNEQNDAQFLGDVVKVGIRVLALAFDVAEGQVLQFLGLNFAGSLLRSGRQIRESRSREEKRPAPGTPSQI